MGNDHAILKKTLQPACEISMTRHVFDLFSYMFKVNNRNTRTCCLYCWLWTYFRPCSSVFIVNFEQVNAGVVTSMIVLQCISCVSVIEFTVKIVWLALIFPVVEFRFSVSFICVSVKIFPWFTIEVIPWSGEFVQGSSLDILPGTLAFLFH